jgi:hypothetical protein
MFIKVFVPNANGKIELSVQELEALLKDAADKAVREKCANCNRNYYGGITYLNNNESNQNWDWTKVTCNDKTTLLSSNNNSKNAIKLADGITLTSAINEMIGE